MKVQVILTVEVPEDWYKGKIGANAMRKRVRAEFKNQADYVLGNVLEELEEEFPEEEE